jgi:hypothetical protein
MNLFNCAYIGEKYNFKKYFIVWFTSRNKKNMIFYQMQIEFFSQVGEFLQFGRSHDSFLDHSTFCTCSHEFFKL